MISVNGLTSSQYAPREAEQPPTVNPPASFETEGKPAPLAQDTAEFTQTQAQDPTSEPSVGTTVPNVEGSVPTEAPPETKQAWYKKGFVPPVIVGSIATAVGIAALTAFNENSNKGRALIGSALTASVAILGSLLLNRGKKLETAATTPAPEAANTTPVEATTEAKTVA